MRLTSRAMLAALMLAFLSTNSPLHAQTARAMQWLDNGLKEKTIEKRREAFEHAVRIDPELMEASYYLGLTCKELRDYDAAIRHLERAVTTSRKADNKLKAAAAYELAITYDRAGSNEKYESTLRLAKQLNSDDQMGATIAFELGRYLYSQRRYGEAAAALRDGLQTSPAEREIFLNLIELAEAGLEHQGFYDQALEQQQAGNLTEAHRLLGLIVEQDPRFRDVSLKYAALSSQLEQRGQASRVNSLVAQARDYERNGQYELAAATFDEVLRLAPDRQDIRAAADSLRAVLAASQQRERLANEYAAAQSAMREKNWARALVAFEGILNLDPDFEDARQQKRLAQSELERATSSSLAERHYNDGKQALHEGNLRAALAAFERAHQIDQEYRDVASMLAEVEEQMQQTAPSANTAAHLSAADSLFAVAMNHIEHKQWQQALLNLERYRVLQPADEKIEYYLEAVRTNLTITAGGEAAVAVERWSSMAILSCVAAVVMLPVIGVLLFSPATRARYHTLAGNRERAIAIYERLLFQNPAGLSYYTRLADLYVLQSRRDPRAISLYRKVLQLNLITANRDQISALLNEKYITDTSGGG